MNLRPSRDRKPSSSTRAIDVRRQLGIAFMIAALIVAAIAVSQLLPSSATSLAPNPTLLSAAGSLTHAASPTPQSITREPLIPTSARATPTPLVRTIPGGALRATPLLATTLVAAKTVNAAATLTSAPQPTNAPTVTTVPPVQVGSALYTTRQRLCVGVPYSEADPGSLAQLEPGWYLNWRVQSTPDRPAGAEFVQMVRVSSAGPRSNLATLAGIAQQTPGALWLIGNEMDVKWQDDVMPERYATIYHDVYAALKQADPTSRIAIGGVSQPTPLRLQYLDRILAAYRQSYGEDIPVDVWSVHNFILQEKRGGWGVDIPPSIDADSGQLYSIDDHGSLDDFKQQLYAFRQWMAQRGYRDKELLVTEYGILMPPDYGFGYERVRDFMLGTFDFMRTAASSALGLPADGNRLVQRWCWYSLSDDVYPTGNLIDFNTQELTPLGRDFKAYVAAH